MPRKNKRKDYLTGKRTALFGEPTQNAEQNPKRNHKPQCAGCAFADYGGVCTATDGKCLLGSVKTDYEEIHNVTS